VCVLWKPREKIWVINSLKGLSCILQPVYATYSETTGAECAVCLQFVINAHISTLNFQNFWVSAQTTPILGGLCCLPDAPSPYSGSTSCLSYESVLCGGRGRRGRGLLAGTLCNSISFTPRFEPVCCVVPPQVICPPHTDRKR